MILSKRTSHINFNDLQAKEKTFMGRDLDNPCYFKSPVIQNLQKENWKIRLKEKYFIEWMDGCKRPTLFFDEASKVNLGFTGLGDIIRN